MATDWYFMENGQVQGPVSGTQLQQFVGLGRVRPNTKVTKGSSGTWIEAVKVKGLSFPTGSIQPPLPPVPIGIAPGLQPSTYSPQAAQSQEELIWAGRPSQIVNLGSFIVCGLLFWLVVPILVALWNWLTVTCIRYELTNQRFRVIRGVLSRRTDELELYRIKDTSLVQTFWLRIFSLANIFMLTSDLSTPSETIVGIPFDQAKELREALRSHVEQLRERKRVREIDLN